VEQLEGAVIATIPAALTKNSQPYEPSQCEEIGSDLFGITRQ